MAVLNFILSSAAKHSVDGESLSSELQQLGLPKGRDAGRPVGELSLGQEPEACPLSGPAPTFTLPQSTRPACVAVTRRSKALCRSICEPAACAVRVARTCAVRVVRVARARGNLGSVLQGNVDGRHLSSEVTHEHTSQSRACGLQLGFFPLGSAVDDLSSQLMSTCPGSEVKGRRASKGTQPGRLVGCLACLPGPESPTPCRSEQAGRCGLAGRLHPELQPAALRGRALSTPAAGGGSCPGCPSPACCHVPLSRQVPGPPDR